MMKVLFEVILSKIYFLLIACLIYSPSLLLSQKVKEVEYDQNQAQMLQILDALDNYKYSNVLIFSINQADALRLNQLYGKQEPQWEKEADKKFVENNKKLKEKTLQIFQLWLEAEDEDKAKIKSTVPTQMLKYFEYLVRYDEYEKEKLNAGYLVTNRYSSIDNISLIALVLVNTGSEEPNIKSDLSGQKVVKLAINLKNDLISVNGKEQFVYNYLTDRISQNDVVNLTLEAQGINSESLEFLPKKYGSTFPIKEDNIQQYLRITEGQPSDYFGEHEVTIGLFDIIRYRYFGKLKSHDNEANQYISAPFQELKNEPTDSTGQIDSSLTVQTQPQIDRTVYNNYLPLFGAEIRYGLPEINYPSLWSERITLNVMWQSNKLGIILPTNGWSSLANSIFNVERKLTNAGIGLYGSLDFPIKLLNQGGVFNMNASYVFGNANTNPVNTSFIFQGRTADQLNDSSSFRSLSISYLPRFHAQFHYSFALNIDNSSYFRFKLGATAFTVERWLELDKPAGIDPQTNREIIEKKNRISDQYSYDDLSKYNGLDQLTIAAISGLKPTEFIAGLSGRIEYYTKSETVPWGFAIQYFDGSFSGDVWLQVPILENLLLRSQAQFFQTAFRDPKPWEVGTIVIPTIQFVYNFSTKATN